ncbi:RPII140-upstream gene protein-like, partial [Mizuhopecten yessoensis]|uniref:RPII140-upstream gene protein-like n=1 Tax=Mizuhopecten yessoensis TaxID=6573 RepID=UPI000B45CC18
MAMDPFKMNSKETFRLKQCLLFCPSKYSVSTKWSTRLLLKFPCISRCATKPTGSVTLNTCKNDHATSSSRTVVPPPDKNTTSLSYSVYQELRSYLRVPVLLAETNKDVLSSDDETNPEGIPLVSKEEVLEYIANETGPDRVRDFFNQNPQGGHHPDFEELRLNLLMSGLLGLFIGYYIGYRKTSIKFREENRSTTFRSAMNYQRMRMDKSLLGGARFALKGGVYLSTFVTLLMGVSKCVSLYRNKSSFVEYSIAASVTGALFRVHLGPKGVVAGGIVGLTLGTIAGLPLFGLAKATGETEENRHFKYIEEKLAIK